VPSFQRYPFNIPVVRSLELLPLHPKVTFLVGENGTGKSTLLEAIAVAFGFNAEGGNKNFNFATRASHSELSDYFTLVRHVPRPTKGFFLRAESLFTLATEIENLGLNGYYGGALHERSHGEAFLALFLYKFEPGGFYVFDEPEAALSPQRQLAILRRIDELAKAGCQFVIATHSPIILAYPDATIYQCSEDGIRKVAWEETEHYQITRDFLADPHRIMGHLFKM
jgi:predicted ATPase